MGNERRRNVDGARQADFDCLTIDVLLRIPPPASLATFSMSATWCSLLLMVLANLWYMPWELVFSCISAQYATFFSRIFTLCLTATRFFRAYRQSGDGPLMNG
jgi:hypothetical protein